VLDADGICVAQQRVGAGALVIDGALRDRFKFNDLVSPGTQARMVPLGEPVIERTVNLTSTGNLSAVTFTVAGYNARGTAVTEDIAGPNNNTVYTTAFYAIVTSVSTSATIGTDVTLGSGTTGYSAWYPLDIAKESFNVSLQVDVTAAITYSVQHTLSDIQNDTTPAVLTNSDLSADTTDADGNYILPVRAVRLYVSASDATGTLDFFILQAGV
jgi:hypothetical protein